MSRLFLLTFLFTTPVLLAQDDAWIQDFAKAKAQAKAEKKHLLVDFTGSDWCIWCKRLDKEVFAEAAFKTAAPKDFVLVKIDFPQDEGLVTAEVKAQNEKLQEQYGIQGFPTVLLMDAEGRPYAQTGYEKGGPDKYVPMLADLKKKGDAFCAAMVRADAAKGGDRAKALGEALATLEAEVVGNYHLATMEEIVKLDADGKAGVKAKYEAKVKEIGEAKAAEKEMQSISQMLGPLMQSGEGDQALAKLEEMIKAPKSKGQHQAALFFKGMVIMDTSHDAKAALEALAAAKALAPESPIAKQIDTIRAQIEKEAGKGGDDKKEGGDKKDGGK